jgi:hypothetical protein
MPEGVGYGPQFTASVGPGLNYVGDKVYSYGGEIGVADAWTTILGPFTTGKHAIVGELQITDNSGSNDDIRYKIQMNGIDVQKYISKNASEPPGYPTILVIPPFTTIEVSGYNITSSSSRNQTAMFTGKTV